MTPAEASACQREDGCTVISQALLNQMLEQALQQGMATCESGISLLAQAEPASGKA